MSERRASWPRRFIHWLFGGPFQMLPAPFGNVIPQELQAFEAQADNARRHGLGRVASRAASHHAKTRPARDEGWLERQ